MDSEKSIWQYNDRIMLNRPLTCEGVERDQARVDAVRGEGVNLVC